MYNVHMVDTGKPLENPADNGCRFLHTVYLSLVQDLLQRSALHILRDHIACLIFCHAVIDLCDPFSILQMLDTVCLIQEIGQSLLKLFLTVPGIDRYILFSLRSGREVARQILLHNHLLFLLRVHSQIGNRMSPIAQHPSDDILTTNDRSGIQVI